MLQLNERLPDVGGKCIERGTVGIWSNAQDDVRRQISWEELEPRELSKSSFELIPCDGRVFESGHHETDPHSCSGWTRERGSGSPDLDMSGPDALPLSHDALDLRAPRNTRFPRKAE